jgi:hypothetical protein
MTDFGVSSSQVRYDTGTVSSTEQQPGPKGVIPVRMIVRSTSARYSTRPIMASTTAAFINSSDPRIWETVTLRADPANSVTFFYRDSGADAASDGSCEPLNANDVVTLTGISLDQLSVIASAATAGNKLWVRAEGFPTATEK